MTIESSIFNIHSFKAGEEFIQPIFESLSYAMIFGSMSST
jgi:hypothetical protein